MSKHQPKAAFARTDRIADEIQHELAVLIQQRVKDPRLPAMVSVNQVKVSKDLAFADVYVTSLQAMVQSDSEEVQLLTEEILASAAGFLRTELSRAIKLRTMPRLRFHYDRTAELGSKMDELIRDARATDGDAGVEQDDISSDNNNGRAE